MSRFPSIKKFLAPDSGVMRRRGSRRPIPKRETALEGTRVMKTDNAAEKHEWMKRPVSLQRPVPKFARVLGWTVWTCAISCLLAMALAFYGNFHSAFGMYLFLGLASCHILVLFEQILSEGKSGLGTWALLVFWVGCGLMLILEWLLFG